MKDGAWVHAVMEKTRPSELECHIVNSNDLKTVLGLMSFASIYLYSQVRLGANSSILFAAGLVVVNCGSRLGMQQPVPHFV